MEIELSEFNNIITNYSKELEIIELNGAYSLGSTTLYRDSFLQEVVASIDKDKNGKITYYQGGYID